MNEIENLDLESLVQFENPIESEPLNLDTKEKKKLLINQIESRPDLTTILNTILPPRQWSQDSKHYIQYVSQNPTSREDVGNLQSLLDQRLLSRQARDTGICPIREELHSQCFDEIIRQVTIDSPERGLLLMRVRDELKMTISAYMTLYKSSVSFGMRKEVESEEGRTELEESVKNLDLKKEELLKKKQELLNKKKAIEKRIDEKRIQDQIKKRNEIEFLEYQNNHLKSFFENLQSKQS